MSCFERFGCEVNRLSIDELFQRYMQTGFLYPDKLERLAPFTGEILENWRRAADSRVRSRIGRALQLGGPGDIELYWETCRCLEAALEAVRPADARLLRQVELEARSLRDVARALGIRTNTAEPKRSSRRTSTTSVTRAMLPHAMG